MIPSILPGFLILFLGVSYPKWYFPVMGGSSPLSSICSGLVQRQLWSLHMVSLAFLVCVFQTQKQEVPSSRLTVHLLTSVWDFLTCVLNIQVVFLNITYFFGTTCGTLYYPLRVIPILRPPIFFLEFPNWYFSLFFVVPVTNNLKNELFERLGWTFRTVPCFVYVIINHISGTTQCPHGGSTGGGKVNVLLMLISVVPDV